MSGTFDVYVANLPPSYNESEIREVFDVAGEIQGVKILPNKNGNQGNVAFVKFISESDAQCCAQYMHNHSLDDGRTLTVRYRAKSQAPNGIVTNSNSSQVNEKSGLTNGSISSKADEMVKIFVSHVETPIEFWAQSCSDASAVKLDEITKKMEDLCPTQPKVIGQLSTEQIYGCKFSEDELWYRCNVEKSLAKNEVHVRYIDYGNAEVAERFGLVTLPADISKIPPLCECYRVDGLELVTTDIQSELFLNGLEVLSDLINEEKIEVKIRKKEKDVTFVKIYQDSDGTLLDIPTKLIPTGSIKVKMAGHASSFATAVKTQKTPPKTTFNHITSSDYSSAPEPLMKISKSNSSVAEKETFGTKESFGTKETFGTKESFGTKETFGTKEIILPEKSSVDNTMGKGRRTSEEPPQISNATLEMYKEKIENSANLIEQLKKQLIEKNNLLDGYLNKPPTPAHIPESKPAAVIQQTEATRMPSKKTSSPPPGFKHIENGKSEEELVIKEKPVKVSYSDVGGYKKEITQIKEMVELPLHHAKLFEDLGIKPPRGILLTGSPGTGKTLIARAVANEMGVFFKEIFGPSIVSGSVEDSRKKLTEAFIGVLKNSPAILLIDRIDAIAPAKDSDKNKVTSQLLSLLNCLKKDVIIIATVNRINNIDPMVRQFGVFDREINLVKPDVNSRLDILRILTKNMNLAKDVCINKIAQETDGYVGSDLSTLCKLAGMHGIHTKIAGGQGNAQDGRKSINKEVLASLRKIVLKMDNFKHALSVTNPSIREPTTEVPTTSWGDIGGMEKVKKELQQLINYPSHCEKKVARLGTSPSKGVLLYGAHGCGKTLFAKAIATQCKCSFISLNVPELCTLGVRQSKPGVRDIFLKAHMAAPCIIFIDEIDLITKGGDSSSGGGTYLINEILTEIDDIEEKGNVYIIAAANIPTNVHPAFRRSGRLGQLVHIPLPDETSRKSILERKLRNTIKSEEINSDYLSELAKHTEGFSGADFENIISRACRFAADDGENGAPSELSHRHFEGAIKAFCPSVNDADVEECKKFAQEQNTNSSNKNEKEIIEYLKKSLETKEGGESEIKQLNNARKNGKRASQKNNYVVLLGLFTIACFIYLLVLYIYTSMRYQ